MSGKVRLYPEPPHLSIAVYCDGIGDGESLSLVCSALRGAGGVPTGDIIIHPGDPFEFVSDVPDRREISVAPDVVFQDFISSENEECEILSVAFSLQPVGLIVATFDPGQPGLHPVALRMGSGALGLPHDVRTEEEAAEAHQISEFRLDLLRHICNSIDPLYAHSGIEVSLSGPRELISRQSAMHDVFISHRLLGDDLPGDISSSFEIGNNISEWNSGVYISSNSDLDIDFLEEGVHEKAEKIGRLLGSFLIEFDPH